MPDISKATARKFVARWKKLRDQRAKVDFEQAGLAHEIRQCFPKGPSGDQQFGLWVQRHLDVWAPTAAMLLRAAKSFALFPDEADWINFGGWQSMGFLLSFSSKDRRKIASAVRKIVDARDHTVGYTTVRNTAYTLGCRQNRVTGRPNRLEVEEKLGALRTYVETLIDNGTIEAEDLPPAARSAMTQTQLSRIEAALSV